MKGMVAVAGQAMAHESAAPEPARCRGAGRGPDRAEVHVVRPHRADVLQGTVHDVDLPIIEKDITVAEGFVVHAWTFGGTVPGR